MSEMDEPQDPEREQVHQEDAPEADAPEEILEEIPGATPEATTDIVASTLARLRSAGVSRETSTPRGASQHGSPNSASRSAGRGDQRSGPGPDERDPQGISRSLERLMRERGWQQSAAVGAMLVRWKEIVGPEVGDHCTPDSFDVETHRLVLRAESTAWKTQLQMMLPLIRQRIDSVVGRGVISDISIVGPAPPKRYKGPGRISGRGPRDTWG